MRSQFVFQEGGRHLFDPGFRPVVDEVGRAELSRGEGPAVFTSVDDSKAYLLIDEFERRGYRLFVSESPAEGAWTHVEAALPPHARHGSVMPITGAERARLIRHFAAG